MIHPVRSVGDPIQSRCTKCRKVTRHIVVSMVEGRAAKVQCTLCQGFHNFRPPVPPSPAEKRPRASSTPRKRRSASAIEEEWKALVEARNPLDAVPYEMGGRYRAGELIEHPAFGRGLVRKTVPPDKIEVLFREGIKRLRCA
ncbi:MAG: hypothetical protein Kow0092_25620 [Deferrisomatales bacterium]